MILDCYFSLYTYPISALEMCLCPDNDTCSCPRKGIRRQSCLAYQTYKNWRYRSISRCPYKTNVQYKDYI